MSFPSRVRILTYTIYQIPWFLKFPNRHGSWESFLTKARWRWPFPHCTIFIHITQLLYAKKTRLIFELSMLNTQNSEIFFLTPKKFLNISNFYKFQVHKFQRFSKFQNCLESHLYFDSKPLVDWCYTHRTSEIHAIQT